GQDACCQVKEMNEVEDRVAVSLDKNMGPEMDLVNRPNPWLPAYGFQIQHANYQPTHEDLRASETMIAQQVDFLETILEETSDDLQSDSDRSGTTYWLGSDSDTESVIHIKAAHRTTGDERQDGSGSECNSVVPKKRRRRNNNCTTAGGGGSDSDSQLQQLANSGSSAASSRSSSLLQFESLERSCATLSPSGYSFDSLEYNRRLDHRLCASPDSLDSADYAQLNGHGSFSQNSGLGYNELRPCRSFESLTSIDKRPNHLHANGFASAASHAFSKNCDLSRLAPRPSAPSNARSRRHNKQINSQCGRTVVCRGCSSSSNLRRVVVTAQALILASRTSGEARPAYRPVCSTQRCAVAAVLPRLPERIVYPSTSICVPLPWNRYQEFQRNTEQQEVETMASTLAMSNSLELQVEQLEPGKVVGEEKLRMKKRSRAEAASSSPKRTYNGEIGQPEEEDEHALENKPLTHVIPSTVKTQDPLENGVLEFARAAVAMDANVEQAILQLKREVEQAYPGGVKPSVAEDTVSDGLHAVPTETCAEYRAKMEKYNASYEQAVRSRMDEQDYPTRPDIVASFSTASNSIDGDVVMTETMQPESSTDRMAMMGRYNASYEQAIRNRMDSSSKTPTIETTEEEIDPVQQPGQSEPSTDRMLMMGRYNASYEQAIRNRMDSNAKAPTVETTEEEEEEIEMVASEISAPDRLTSMGKYNVSYEQAIKSRMDDPQSGLRRKLYQDNSGDSSVSGKPLKNASYELSRQNDLLRSFSHKSQDIVEEDPPSSPPRRLKKSSIESATSSSPCVALRNEEEDQLLENKPIGSHLLGSIATHGSEHYLDNLTPVTSSSHQSKSCDDFSRNAWGATEHEGPPLQRRQRRAAAAAQTSAATPPTGIISSPASVLQVAGSVESLRSSNNNSSSSSALSPLNSSQRGISALQEADTVQPRSGEMSATAAKRLAMSGEQMTLSTSHGSLGMLSAPPTPKSERKKGGLGGFLQRFSKLRFSGRSKVPRSELQQHRNKSANGGGGFSPSISGVSGVGGSSGGYVSSSSGKKGNEPDYIIIPLHAPDEDLMRPVNGEIEDHLQPQYQHQQRRRRSSEEAVDGRQQQYNNNSAR
ncbi:hypothetical protein QAD02_015686, partial [Eretmocerus hayati]